MLAFTVAELQAMVEAILDAAGPYQDFEIGLFVNDVTPDENTVIGDLTEPGGDWYARVQRLLINQPHWTAPYLVPGPGVEVAGLQTVSFAYGASADPEETVYGYFVVVDVGGTPRMVAAGRLDDPKAMGVAGDAIVLTPQLSWPLLQMPEFGNLAAE